MSQSAIPVYRFSGAASLPLEARFDEGRVTSDGGLPWLEHADTALGLTATFAALVPEWRRAPVATAGDAGPPAGLPDRLRLRGPGRRRHPAHRPAAQAGLRSVAGNRSGSREPTDPVALENALDRRACYRLAVGLGELYLRERERDGAPRHIILDLDGTDDPTHGAQEGSAYHGYYRQHMYHPLLVFDGETGQLITAVLRPGNTHGSTGVVAVLKRIVRALRERWPGVSIDVRLDSGGAVPAIYDGCEQAGITYTIGLITNPRLTALAAPLVAAAQRQRAESGAEKVRLCGEVTYQAESWDHPRRVVIKAEALPKGPNTRFVVTTRSDPPETLYDWYVDRGEREGWITDLKVACFADRLSDHRFWANQFRLMLHAAAYWLLDTIRRWLGEGSRAHAVGHVASAPAQGRWASLPMPRPRPPAARLQPPRPLPLGSVSRSPAPP